MPAPQSRRFFGVVLISAIFALGLLAAGRLAWAAITQTGTYSATILAPEAKQLHYRWRNDDGGEQAAALNWATTSPSRSLYLLNVAIDEQYLYAVGITTSSFIWSLEKRNLSDGALVYATATNRAGEPIAIAVDAQYTYVVGDDNAGPWYIEKRDKSTGALIYTVSSSAGTDSASWASDIDIDGNVMFVTGTGGSSTVQTWRIEKRNLSDGSLVTTFASSGVLIVANSTGSFNWIISAVDKIGAYIYTLGDIGGQNIYIKKFSQIDGSSIFSTSTDVLSGPTDLVLNADKTSLFMGGGSNGCGCDWALESRSASSGALLWSIHPNYVSSGVRSFPKKLAVDNTYLYVLGGEDTPSGNPEFIRWRAEKRLQSNGTLMYATTSDPTAGSSVDGGFGMAINGESMFSVGVQSSSFARIEKRSLGHDTSTATFSTSEDNPLLNLGVGTLARLRMMVQNAGDAIATSSLYRLEYATSTSGPWTRVGSPASTSVDWITSASAYLSSTQGTHNITGLTDPTSTVSAWYSGEFKSTSSQATLTSTLNPSQFTEYEYAVKGTGSSTLGIPYYFRLTNQGTSLDTYSIYASATLATAPISLTAITVNSGNAIILTPNATTSVSVSWTVSGGNGCGSVFYGASSSITSTLYRSGVSSTCASTPTQSTLNCYYTATTTNNCTSNTSTASANATTTFQVWYFAESTANTTTASSSYAGQDWRAFVGVKNGSGTTSTAVSASGVGLEALLAITLNSSTFNYGTVLAGTNTSGTNQTTNVKNAGNATTTLQVSGNAMSNGSYNMPTSSQHYATSTFTYGVSDVALTSAATAVGGWLVEPVVTIGNSPDVTPLPSPRGIAAGVAANGYLYVIAGQDVDNNGTSSVLFSKPSSSGTISNWTTTSQLPSPLVGARAAVVGNYVYVSGGESPDYNSGATSTVLYALINATGSLGAWATTTILPGADTYHGMLGYNGYLYYIATWKDIYFAQPNANGTISSWTLTTALPHDETWIGEFGAAAGNGYLYVALGAIPGPSQTSTVVFAPINATGSLGAWQTGEPMPEAGHDNGTNLIYANGMLYWVGDASGYGDLAHTVYFSPLQSNGMNSAWGNSDNYEAMSVALHLAQNGFLYSIGGMGGGPTMDSVYGHTIGNRNLYWGLAIPATSTPGAYTSTVTFTAVYSP